MTDSYLNNNFLFLFQKLLHSYKSQEDFLQMTENFVLKVASREQTWDAIEGNPSFLKGNRGPFCYFLALHQYLNTITRSVDQLYHHDRGHRPTHWLTGRSQCSVLLDRNFDCLNNYFWVTLKNRNTCVSELFPNVKPGTELRAIQLSCYTISINIVYYVEGFRHIRWKKNRTINVCHHLIILKATFTVFNIVLFVF